LSTPTDIERRAKQMTKRQEREAKRRYELLAGQVRSQLRRQLDDIMRTNMRPFILLLANGGALKVGIEAVEKLPEPVIDETKGQQTVDGRGPVDTEAAGRILDDQLAAAARAIDAFDQTAYDEIKSGKIPPALFDPETTGEGLYKV